VTAELSQVLKRHGAGDDTCENAVPEERVAQSLRLSNSAVLNMINIHFLLMHQKGTECLRAKPCPSEGPQSLNGGDSALPAKNRPSAPARGLGQMRK